MILFEEYADPRAMKYLVLRTPYIAIGYILVYLLAIIVGKKLMANRPPYDLRKFVAVYNVTLVGICIYIIKLAFAGGFKYDYLWRCYGIDYTSQKEEDLTMLSMCHLTFLLKGLELIETIIFVLRKKNNQVSFFHVYHHVSTLSFGWFASRTYGGGMQVYSYVINQMVHVIMYTYYFLSALGLQRQLNPIKKCITGIQITQICLILTNLVAQLRCDNIYKGILWLFIPNVAFILYLFIDFFRKNYISLKKIK